MPTLVLLTLSTYGSGARVQQYRQENVSPVPYDSFHSTIITRTPCCIVSQSRLDGSAVVTLNRNFALRSPYKGALRMSKRTHTKTAVKLTGHERKTRRNRIVGSTNLSKREPGIYYTSPLLCSFASQLIPDDFFPVRQSSAQKTISVTAGRF